MKRRNWDLERVVSGAEGVAAAGVAGSKAFLQPAHALLRGAVVESLGHGAAIGLFLQVVVADFGGGVQCLFDPSAF